MSSLSQSAIRLRPGLAKATLGGLWPVALGLTLAACLQVFIKPHVDAFLSGETVKVYGVPLEEWTDVNESRRGVFQQYGIRSVEEIVNAPESIVIRMSPVMPDVRRWQEKAAKYLADCAEGKTRAVIAERDDRINTLESQLGEMREMMQQLLGAKIAEASGEPEKRRGRPPKIPIDQPVEDAAAA